MNTNERTAELVGRIQESGGADEEAKFSLFEMYNERLMGLVCSKFKQQLGFQSCEDVVDEVWVKAFKSICRYQHQDRFWGWLWQIAFNAGLDAIKRLPKIGAERGDDQLATIPDRSAVEAHDKVAQNEARQRVLEAVNDLPEYTTRRGARVQCSEVIQLRFFEGLTRLQIAEQLQVTLEEVRQVEKYALERLAAVLGMFGEDST